MQHSKAHGYLRDNHVIIIGPALRHATAPYLHTSLPFENVECRITSGAIHAYVPAALIRVVFLISRASPKSVIFKTLPA